MPPPGATHDFARGHTEQHMAITGAVQVGAQRFDLTAGLGLRDHSWGPRIWQSIWWYRWITASFGPLGIACTLRGEEAATALTSAATSSTVPATATHRSCRCATSS